MTEPLETTKQQPQPSKPGKTVYKKIAILVLIILITIFFGYSLLSNYKITPPRGESGTVPQIYTKTITVKALSPTGSDMGLGIFATDERGYLAYPNDANVTTGEKNISIGKTYDITYYNEVGTQFRIITHIEKNITSI
jgi:hypothetical protein